MEARPWIVDAVEDGVARVEAPDGRVLELPAAWLPEGARGGAALEVVPLRDAGWALVALRLDVAAGAALRRSAAARRGALGGDDPGGDLDL